MTIEKAETRPLQISFMLLSNYSMIAFTSAIEPLRMANRAAGKTLYKWQVCSVDGEIVAASNGIKITPDCIVDELARTDIFLVCGGVNVADNWTRQLQFTLRRVAKLNQITLGALCTGSYILAKAGLLDGYKCTIHWENIPAMREEFPNALFHDGLFQIDRDRMTCAGGQAAMDLMLKVISDAHGNKLASHISEQFMCERIRSPEDRQRIPLHIHLGANQPKLTEAVTLMESNLEEPISLDELSGYVGISRRQLERLFQKHLNCVPTRYYLNLRLNRARLLLLQTSKSIVDIALACGFISAPHFSKCYRDLFGIPPRDERRRIQSGDNENQIELIG
ncbi:MAG: transcriptional regulator GlxA family with amidase domain [Gammaproteobacteria bacterium]|jgi:transcriptional regulator GlxA family with amidase domain